MLCLVCSAIVVVSPLCAETPNLQHTLNGHKGIVYTVTFSPDGKVLASSDENGSIKLWDPSTGKVSATLVTPKAHPREKIMVRAIAISPDGKTLAAGTTNSTGLCKIQLWDVASAKNTATFNGKAAGRRPGVEGIYTVAFGRDGKTLASGHEDNVIRIWDLCSGAFVTTFQVDAGDSAYSVAFSPDGKTLAAGGQLGTIKIWDVSSGKNSANFEGGGRGNAAYSVVFSPDGKFLAAACWLKNGAVVWEVASGKNIAKFKPDPADSKAAKDANDMTSSVAFSPDGAILASGCDNGLIGLWDVTRSKKIAVFNGHTDLVRSLAFIPDGKLLASGSNDGTVKLWNLKGTAPKDR